MKILKYAPLIVIAFLIGGANSFILGSRDQGNLIDHGGRVVKEIAPPLEAATPFEPHGEWVVKDRIYSARISHNHDASEISQVEMTTKWLTDQKYKILGVAITSYSPRTRRLTEVEGTITYQVPNSVLISVEPE